MDTPDIPVIDLAAELASQGKESLAARIAQICHEIGFFVVTNHGVRAETRAAAFERSAEFFRLSMDQKLLIDKRNSRHFRGWEGEGAEYTNNRPDIREQIDFWTAHTPRPVAIKPGYLRLLGPNQWPPETLVPGFRTAIETWITEVEKLADTLLGLMCLGLGLDEKFLQREFGDECMSLCKVIKYPPTPAGQFGVNAHHDAGILTVLATDDTPGLEIDFSKDHWIPVPVIDDGLVINLGEVIQKMTGNYFVATPHRVTTSKARQSIGYFHGPSLNMQFNPLPLDEKYAAAVAASDKHSRAGFMVQPDEVAAGAEDMSSPHHPDIYGEQLWNYFKRSYPDNVKLHYPTD